MFIIEMSEIYVDKFFNLVVKNVTTGISCVVAISYEKLEDWRRMLHLTKEVKSRFKYK